MGETLTKQQEQAVYDRGGQLLVSAAAGSGKTKVLVDRLLSYLTDPVKPSNIDDFLIITYTKAAAAELRGKISAKISEKVSKSPENQHLHHQIQRLYLAKISTVHSFCGDILRENAYRLDIPADFRVADENECVEIQSQVLHQILEHAYEEAQFNHDFCAFIDSQGFGRDDRLIPEIVLKVYHSAMCHLDPDKWLDWCLLSSVDDTVSDAVETVWGQYLLSDLRCYLDLQIDAFNNCISEALSSPGMERPAALLGATVDQLVTLRNCTGWDDVCRNMAIDYGRLSFSKQCTDLVLIDQIKAVREACKKGLTAKLRRFSGSSAQMLADMSASAYALRGLLNLVKEFKAAYDKAKRARHILDFSDLEQKTLDLLVGKQRLEPTSIARELGLRYKEVLVDEYQDSNEVQDAIFRALTAFNGNCFMVGDVKQSIYQFRLADPGIFLEKYNSFLPAEEAKPGQGRKVLLSSNFRSSAGVIKAVNDVFSCCMSPSVGGLEYGTEEQLHEGVPHIQIPDDAVELYGIDVQEDTYAEEAAFVADKIEHLLDGKHLVRDGEDLRPIVPEDIVILLRSPGSVGADFQYALAQRNINCVTGSGMDMFKTEEIQTLIAILQIINNPLQDIYLVATMMSRVFSYSADEMASIRSRVRRSSIYDAVRQDQSEKTVNFLNVLSELRRAVQTCTLVGLINQVFALTKLDSIFAALPDGAIRLENLHSFSNIAAGCETMGMSSVGRFLDHLSSMEGRGITVAGEQRGTGAVTIMSIHKSKGLEFPVVFLCGLSRDFNKESSRAQVLCDKTLGLGLSCVDSVNRVRYPSIAKHAIAAKINAEGLSEEMRVLYVAMTRAKDRLIMTYAARKLSEEIDEIANRTALCKPELLTVDAQCPGEWVLLTSVLHRNDGWCVKLVRAPEIVSSITEEKTDLILPQDVITCIKDSLSFEYNYQNVTKIPSKQTATQLKGRQKDSEVAENTQLEKSGHRMWRKPSFVEKVSPGNEYGTLMHRVMQYLNFDACADQCGITSELNRLVCCGFISNEQAKMIQIDQIEAFMRSELGEQLRKSGSVLREFKFSILDDASKYDSNVEDEKILLQGVVDCALIDEEGITILDFKTDRVTEETLQIIADSYAAQLKAYAFALSKIYQLPIIRATLYFFKLNRFVDVKVSV